MTEKHDIYSLFRYPSSYINRNLELHQCPYKGAYERKFITCKECYFARHCESLRENDPEMMFTRSLHELHRTLAFAISYVTADIQHHFHRHSCDCDACNWLRHARQALRKSTGFDDNIATFQ